MSYCNRADLENRFGTEVITELEYERPSAVATAIADAASLIDSYIAARYQLPLVAVPPVMVGTACDLVRYDLDIDPSDAIKDRKTAAMKYLESLSQGKATLGLPQNIEPESSGTAEIQSDGHVFKRSSSKGFI